MAGLGAGEVVAGPETVAAAVVALEALVAFDALDRTAVVGFVVIPAGAEEPWLHPERASVAQATRTTRAGRVMKSIVGRAAG